MENSKMTPMMLHYLEVKKDYPDTVVFYRLGDFYEVFFEDAKKVSAILELTLTGRDCGLTERAPMCGVPFHAVEGYLAKLVAVGIKVAICEQLSAVGDQKGMLKRDVVRVITPGTQTDEGWIDATKNNYLVAVATVDGRQGVAPTGSGTRNDSCFSLAYADITTGEVMTQIVDGGGIESALLNLAPAEIIADGGAFRALSELSAVKAKRLPAPQNYYAHIFGRTTAEREILEFYKVATTKAYALSDEAIPCLGALLHYISATQKAVLKNILPPRCVDRAETMFLDHATVANLELIESMADRTKKGSLLSVIDNTKTKMGARTVRKWLLSPLRNVDKINKRILAQKELTKDRATTRELSRLLLDIRDTERLSQKIATGTVGPRDVLGLKNSLLSIKPIKEATARFKSALLRELSESLNPLTELVTLLGNAMSDDAPVLARDGGIFKQGYNAELDKCRDAERNGLSWISRYEAEERARTGIKNLKVAFNKVFGYYIEISNAYRGSVPVEYERKQTVSNGERYMSAELKRLETIIMSAGEKAMQIEEKLYAEIKTLLLDALSDIQLNSTAIGALDVLNGLAELSQNRNYCAPEFNTQGVLDIKACRHPVVECAKAIGEFVANDVSIDNKNFVQIITGPNMAGKSTYMREIALCVLMAHCGFFVPATEAKVPLLDRIFTRIGAGDNLSSGQSTFMVEMIEMSNILANATKDSLIILDEVGRGTSTLDGISIAWAVVEHISLRVKAKTLFATHYHELAELEKLLPNVRNYNVLIREQKENITFLYKIARGSASRSFGIEVARMAGITGSVIARAKAVLEGLETSHVLSGEIGDKAVGTSEVAVPVAQLGFFEEAKPTEIEEILNSTDIDNCTPVQAITILANLKRLVKKQARGGKK